MKIFTVLILMILVMNTAAQITFEKTYGTIETEETNAVIQTQDHGYLLAGYNQIGSNSSHPYLVKTDEQGDTIWTKTYSSQWSSGADAVVETSDGYVFTGYKVVTLAPSKFAIQLVKIDKQGDTLWTKIIPNSNEAWAEDIRITRDGGFIICGYEEVNYYNCYHLVKVSSTGDTVWTRRYNWVQSIESQAKQVLQTADGGYIMIGNVDDYTYLDGTGFISLVRTDSVGNMLWTKNYDWSGWDLAYSIAQTNNGGYIVGGFTWSQGAGKYDMYLMRTDEQGDSLWLKTYGGVEYDRGYAVQAMADGGFVFAGQTNSYGSGDDDFYLVRTDSIGDTLWTRTIGGWNREDAYDLELTADGGYVLAGNILDGSRTSMHLVKTDANGLITSIHNPANQSPADFHLFHNYPNPFNPATTISYILNKTTDVSLSIYDTAGRLVNILVNTKQAPGFKSIQWSGIDFRGTKVSSGIYICVLKANNFKQSLKMVLLK